MRFTVVTLFPEMFASFLEASLLGKARAAGIVSVDFVNPREFAPDPHRMVDDSPYGGGAGMVLKVEPMVAAIESARSPAQPEAEGEEKTIMFAPSGVPLEQRTVREFAKLDHLVLVCGRYEGPDERIIEEAIDEVVSIGDYVLSGGEVAAMTTIDAVARLIPGVLGKMESTEDESFETGLLEYPHYTRPVSFRGRDVPDVLRSGNHEAIRKWRRTRALQRTRRRRPDLYQRHQFTAEDRKLESEPSRVLSERAYVVLAHYPVLDRTGAQVTSSVTNLDIHDLARSAATFGLAGTIAVSPIEAQRDKIDGICATWRRLAASEIGDHRHHALETLESSVSLEAALARVTEVEGEAPLVVATSAQASVPTISDGQLRARFSLKNRPVVLVFGTGWGLAPDALTSADLVLDPILGLKNFNHLSVRSAVAIILDRLFGVRPSPSAKMLK